MKILLVEDNEMNRDMLSRRLIRKGHEVVMAFDGEQGVTMARDESLKECDRFLGPLWSRFPSPSR